MNAEKETRISNTGNLFCFNSNVSNLYNERVVEKTNDMIFNPTKILKLIYISPIESALKKKSHESIKGNQIYIPMYQ
jgi:hypothetical protein